ncbi:hypothetical protein ABEX45_00215 [Bacillus subtilis]
MVKLQKSELSAVLKTAGRIITNKRIAYADDNFLRTVLHKNSLWFSAVGDRNDLLLWAAENKEDDTGEDVNVDYNRLISVLGVLEDNVEIDVDESGIQVKDRSALVKLANLVGNAEETPMEELVELRDEAKDKGVRVNRAEFLGALEYLHGLRDKDADLEVLQDIYFTKTKAYVMGTRFSVRLDFELPIEFNLDYDSSDVLIALLETSDSEEFVICIQEGEGTISFVVDESFYQVSGYTKYIKSVEAEFNAFKKEETVSLNRSEFARFVRLATVFLDSDGDAVIKVSGGRGVITSDSDFNDGSSDGEFNAEGVSDLEVAMNAKDLLLLFGGSSSLLGEELTIELDISGELGYIKHKNGDCLMAVRNLND